MDPNLKDQKIKGDKIKRIYNLFKIKNKNKNNGDQF